jgi:hypothetical protein
MQIQKKRNGTLITLNQPFDDRLKMLNLFYAMLFLGSGYYAVFRTTHEEYLSTGFTVFGLVFSAVFFIGAYRFVSKALLTEKILVTDEEVRLMRKKLFTTKVTVFDIHKITNLNYVEKKKAAPHPLAGQSMDYLGFDTTDKVINQLSGDNQLLFDYEGKTISFGADMMEYEFEEIKSLFDKYQNDKKV